MPEEGETNTDINQKVSIIYIDQYDVRSNTNDDKIQQQFFL